MEKIEELNLGFGPEAAVSGAVLLQSEYTTFLTFNAMKETDRAHPRGGFYRDNAGTAVLEFVNCLISKFGYPNDEATFGIPKYKDLDLAYDICEVTNSEWIRELEVLNSFQFPGTDYSNCRHFLIFFHDSTFECIAKDMLTSISSKPYAETMAELGSKIASE